MYRDISQHINPIQSKSIMSTFDEQTQGTGVTKTFPDRVKGKTFLISGLSRGDLAATTADAPAHGGAGTIVCTGRSQPELQPVLDHIKRKYKVVNIIFVTADPGIPASFQEAAQTIKKLGVTIDGFVGFPEVMAVPWELTVDGLGSHFQRNYLCYFLMLNLLCPIMKPESRVVLVTSSLRNEAPAPSWEDLGMERITIVLMDTKPNVQTYVAMEDIKSWLQRKKEAGEDIPVLLQQAPKSLGQGSATVLRGLLDPELEGKDNHVKYMYSILVGRYEVLAQSGAFLDHCQTPKLPHLDFPAGEESAEALWRRSQELVESFIS
ncbi:Short-chain dehydrogenase/reductase SDR [Penicillium cf. griseofulvum]|uniref:Short-chain dehydrogenase/reductase SDR n=1 Tax=Penicillium cf. griseofulvum TaxID=2972120 RepID=A0A9W9MZV8_9EURO|nr:Short-chain dehydrogenase/reductase SDR [Penicillium cf. griseofulvum]KAJ5424850.1 Short-chain dehydrogenase/reductase SDR [Penicillium cf. griseofulvum]